MILVDSSVWIDYFNGRPTLQTDHLDRLLGTHPVAAGDLILTEVLQGFRDDRHYATAKRLLTTVTLYQLVDRDTALLAADHYRTLRKRGITVRKTIDTLIATFCIRNDLPLLHADKDFEPFTVHLGLRDALANPKG
ncbi:type II toxin-antitoxin system VapC family toxin [Endothiovibrio diazotrophicus]